MAQFVNNYLPNTLMNVDGDWHLARYGLSKSGSCLYYVQLVVVPPKLTLAQFLSVLLSSCKICMRMSWYKLLDINKL